MNQGLVKSNMKESPRQPEEGLYSPADQPLADEVDQTEAPDENVERVVLAGQDILFDQKANQQVLAALKAGADDPAEAIAAVTFDLVSTLDQKAGGKIPEDAIVPAAIRLLEEVGTIAEKSGVIRVGPNTMAQSVQHIIAIAVERGIIEASELAALKDEFAPEEVEKMVAEQQQIAQGEQKGMVGRQMMEGAQ